uniref:ARAD1C17160p n=1 Tax=Blastobotrys adeninivorans TaxID=409370 RepID=A0A060T6X8_BLAAD
MTEKTFSLEGKALKLDTEADIAPHLEGLTTDVTKVVFKGNTIGVEASQALADKLKTLKDLEVADLSDIYTGRLREEIPKSLDIILTALLNCKKLHTIDLSDNAFGIATIDPLESFLAKHTPLEHLILANNGFGPEAGSRIGKALVKLAEAKKELGEDSPKLETVVCGRNRLENGSMEAWAEFLSAHGTIKELRLYQNGIRQEGIEHLFLHGLSASPHLEKLDLQDNTFTLRGATALSKTVASWNGLKELQISDCLLTAKGGEAFGRALLECSGLHTLEVLKLQYNEIDANGLKLLIDAIAKNMPNLKALELNGNRFPEDHEHIDSLNQIFEDRGFGELDELDDMEEETDDEDEDEDEEEEEEEQERESITRDADAAESENVAPEKSKTVDDLADQIAKDL